MLSQAGTYGIQRQFQDFKEESDFSSVLMLIVHVTALAVGHSQGKPQHTLCWAFSCFKNGNSEHMLVPNVWL